MISDIRPTLVTTYWKRRFAVLAWPPSLGSIGPITKWIWPSYQPGTFHSIYSTVVGLRSLLLLPPLKKEIVVTIGCGVIEYLQLDRMDETCSAIFSYCPSAPVLIVRPASGAASFGRLHCSLNIYNS